MLRTIIIALVLFSADIAWGLDLQLSKGKFFDVDESYIEWRKYDSYRNLNTPGKKDWDWTAEFHNTVSVWKRFYWDTNFHMSMDTTQIRYVGFEYYMGLKVMPYLHLIKYHHSQHCTDMDCGTWPVEDSYGMRVIIKGF